MALAATRPSFSFNRPQHLQKPHLLPLNICSKSSPATAFNSLKLPHGCRIGSTVVRSLDVTKEGNSTVSSDNGTAAAAATGSDNLEGEAAAPSSDGYVEGDTTAPKLDPRRFQEQFAVLNTGIHECRSCGYRYNEKAGDPAYPIAPGLPFSQLPTDWRCPTCGAAQSFFESKSVEVAGFAQNQQFGLGGNSLTAGQKALLIYGSLLAGFLFFLSGYFLQ